jgi:predicted metalloprotease
VVEDDKVVEYDFQFGDAGSNDEDDDGSSGSSKSSSNGGMIAGIVVGVIVLLIVIVCVVCCMLKAKASQKKAPVQIVQNSSRYNRVMDSTNKDIDYSKKQVE